MLNKDSFRIARWGITVEIIADVHTIYLKGQELPEARRIIIMDNRIPDKVKDEAITILKLAQNCNAGLQEIRNNPTKGTLRFSFEYEFWEEFLKFKEKIEELSRA